MGILQSLDVEIRETIHFEVNYLPFNNKRRELVVTIELKTSILLFSLKHLVVN